MKKFFSLLMILSVALLSANAQQTDVKFTYDTSTIKSEALQNAQANINKLLTSINIAYENGTTPSLSAVGMTADARNDVQKLWLNGQFHTASDNITDRLWVFSRNKVMQVNHIPMVFVGEEGFVENENCDAVIEFDLTGRITDFRFALDAQTGESFENLGDAASIEEVAIIKKWLERFRTAYNRKDIDFLNMIYSDDALIITGNVVKTRSAEFGTTEKVIYNKQTKAQYLRKLSRCFAVNKYISVSFRPIENTDGGTSRYITRRESNGRTYYGVRLYQSWRSSHYSDEGYVFLLWEFPKGGDPIIHVRTWQPSTLNGKTVSVDEIFSLTDFLRD